MSGENEWAATKNMLLTTHAVIFSHIPDFFVPSLMHVLILKIFTLEKPTCVNPSCLRTVKITLASIHLASVFSEIYIELICHAMPSEPLTGSELNL